MSALILPTAGIVDHFWQDQLVQHHKQALFLALLGFLGSFVFIRISTRMMRSERFPWWPGSVVSESGLHIHHLVFGIVTMMIAGSIAIAVEGASPTFEICALAFGIGMGLTIDEFALWVHLEDVYWAEEGRSSIDATVITASAMALILCGVRPFEIGTDSVGVLIVSLVTAVLVILWVVGCYLKQRIFHGVVGFFIWPIALYGVCRIGKPGSVWAKRRYGARNPAKQAKAERRFRPDRRTERAKNWFRDKIGGAVSIDLDRRG